MYKRTVCTGLIRIMPDDSGYFKLNEKVQSSRN